MHFGHHRDSPLTKGITKSKEWSIPGLVWRHFRLHIYTVMDGPRNYYNFCCLVVSVFLHNECQSVQVMDCGSEHQIALDLCQQPVSSLRREQQQRPPETTIPAATPSLLSLLPTLLSSQYSFLLSSTVVFKRNQQAYRYPIGLPAHEVPLKSFEKPLSMYVICGGAEA